jgi:hypothetical protein
MPVIRADTGSHHIFMVLFLIYFFIYKRGSYQTSQLTGKHSFRSKRIPDSGMCSDADHSKRVVYHLLLKQ